MKKLLSVLVLMSSMAHASEKILIMCVEKSFSPDASILIVKKDGKKLTIEKQTTNRKPISPKFDISDASYTKSEDGFVLNLNRGRSGGLLIENSNGLTGVNINLFEQSADKINTDGTNTNFICNGY